MKFLSIPGGDAAFLVTVAGVEHLIGVAEDFVVRTVTVSAARLLARYRIAWQAADRRGSARRSVLSWSE